MVFRTLISHYRRHPLQAVFLLTSLIMANVLLVGTQLINAQARASYAQGEVVLGAGPIGEIRHRQSNGGITGAQYIALRRQGFHEIAPILQRTVVDSNGQAVTITGIDALAMPRNELIGSFNNQGNGFGGFAFPPYQLWAGQARLRQLGWQTGDRIELVDGGLLPTTIGVESDTLGHRLFIDIGALQELTNSPGELSALLVFDLGPVKLASLQDALPMSLEYVASDEGPDPAQLTRSFHLNLAAMGLLAFVVGLFLTYNALSFSYTDRRELLRKLRLAGITRGQLTGALCLELLLFISLASVIGWWLGSLMAAWLLPGIGLTLAQLYGVYIAYPDSIIPSGFWLPLAMTALAAVASAAFPMRQALNIPLLSRWSGGWALKSAARRDFLYLAAALVALLFAWLATSFASNTWQALIGMACLLFGAALCLPMTLRVLLAGAARLTPSGSAPMSWLIADSRWLLGPASLALMAMTLALVANSGLNTMITSFREATDQWLQQRLVAPVYVRGDVDGERLAGWLNNHQPGVEQARRFRTELSGTSPTGLEVLLEVVNLQDSPEFRGSISLINPVDNADQLFSSGQGLYISERAWRLNGWKPGDNVSLCDQQEQMPILAIYRDYGNPRSQWMVSEDIYLKCWPQSRPESIGLTGPDGTNWVDIEEQLVSGFGLDSSELINQSDLRQAGMSVFDRTFVVTQALNLLTLLVAGIGIFCAISAIHHHRISQQALLSSLGLSRKQRGTLLLTQWGILGLMSMIVVAPFGALLAGYLANVVTPIAFGWSFALKWQWGHFGVLALVAVAALMLAVLIPSVSLLRVNAATLLREQTT